MSRWLTVIEVAEQIGVTPKTVYRLIDSGELPAHRVGDLRRMIRIDAADLDRLMKPIPATRQSS